jgi:hypothetical protein
MMEIAVIAGQKIRFSGRASNAWKSECVAKITNGDTIKAKTHAKIGTIADLSIVEVKDLCWSNLRKCIDVPTLLAGGPHARG